MKTTQLIETMDALRQRATDVLLGVFARVFLAVPFRLVPCLLLILSGQALFLAL